MGCFVKHDDYWKEKTTSYAYIKYFRASERSPFEGSCCGKGYTAVDSLPPSPTESSEIPPPPRYFYSFLPIFRAVLFIQIWYWSTHAHRFATFHWLIWWTIWWASIIGKHSFIIFFSFFPFPFVDVYRYRVVLFGDAGTGKTALVSQFMTSEYMHTYDASLGKFKEFQHSVFVHWCRCILFLRFTNKHWIFLNLSSTKRYKNAINDILSI